jgi:hypothetical protein
MAVRMVLAASPAAFEIAAAKVTFGFHVADHGLDCGTACAVPV